MQPSDMPGDPIASDLQGAEAANPTKKYPQDPTGRDVCLIHASFARLSLNRPSDFSSTAPTHRKSQHLQPHITIGLCASQPQLFASKYPTTSHRLRLIPSLSSYHNTTPPHIFIFNCADENNHDYNLLINSSPPFLAELSTTVAPCGLELLSSPYL